MAAKKPEAVEPVVEEVETEEIESVAEESVVEDEQSAEEQPAEDTTLLRFVGVAYSGTLMIGTESFDVVDGKVRVPARLHAAAHQAGFRA
jgi:hypothetical protein